MKSKCTPKDCMKCKLVFCATYDRFICSGKVTKKQNEKRNKSIFKEVK